MHHIPRPASRNSSGRNTPTQAGSPANRHSVPTAGFGRPQAIGGAQAAQQRRDDSSDDEEEVRRATGSIGVGSWRPVGSGSPRNGAYVPSGSSVKSKGDDTSCGHNTHRTSATGERRDCRAHCGDSELEQTPRPSADSALRTSMRGGRIHARVYSARTTMSLRQSAMRRHLKHRERRAVSAGCAVGRCRGWRDRRCRVRTYRC